MNWQITFEKFNAYFIGQSIFSVVAIIACLGIYFESSNPVAKKVGGRLFVFLMIYHAILTLLWLLCPAKL